MNARQRLYKFVHSAIVRYVAKCFAALAASVQRDDDDDDDDIFGGTTLSTIGYII